jgi:hypothetical protein
VSAATLRHSLDVALMALAVTAASPTQAQSDASGGPPESVTVTAPKVAAPTPFLNGGSRWLFPICPTVIGLTPEQNQTVKDRVYQVAELVGAPHSKACLANAEIVFTAEPQAFLDAVANKRYRLLASTPTQAKAAARVRYPVQSWYSTVWMDQQGTLSLMPPEDDCDGYCFFMGSGPERIVIGAVIIVVDIDKAQGRKLAALSDYVALMALTQAQAFARCQAAPSIANLMAEDCADAMRTDGLTAGDIAWMRRLYHMSDERARKADEKDLAQAAPVPAPARRGD